jgi:phosphate transport system substrate-binding protein
MPALNLPALFSRPSLHRLVAYGLLLLASLAAGAPVRAEVVRVGGTGSAMGSMALLAKAYQQVEPGFQLEVVPNLGSSGGIKALVGGAVHLAAISRPLKADEAAAGLQAMAYGTTAFVVATAKPGIDGVTMSQLADFYSGRQARWPDGQVVRLVLRPASDGDSALLASFSPAVKAALDSAMAREGMVSAMTDQDSADAIERLPGGLGTSSLALLVSERRQARALAIDGVAPTLDNVASGRYPFTKTLYLATRNGPSAAATRFLEFVHSEAGRRVLAMAGHVPVATPNAQAQR